MNCKYIMSIFFNNFEENQQFFLNITLKFLDNQLIEYVSKNDIRDFMPDDFADDKFHHHVNGLKDQTDKVLQALCHMVKEFEKKYESELHVSMTCLTEEYNSNDVITLYKDIILNLFAEKINAGRIIAMFAFFKSTIGYLWEINHQATIKELVSVTMKIFKSRLYEWIVDNDGWVSSAGDIVCARYRNDLIQNQIVEMADKNKKLPGIDLEWCGMVMVKQTVAKIGMFAALELAKSIFQ